MFRKNESNKSQIITFHKNMLFALNDGNIKSRGLEMSLHNISKPTAWCISNSFTVMFWYSFLQHWLTYLLTYLLTYSTEQRSSWEANRFSASQEIPRILRNPKVHCHIHKCPPSVPILSQINPVHVPTFHFRKIYLNIILSPTPESSERSFPSGSPPNPCMHLSLPYNGPMLCSSHYWFYHPNNIGWGVQIIKLLIM